MAQRLPETGEQVLDVPAKLAARIRLFDTARDAHSIAVVAAETPNLHVLKIVGHLEATRMPPTAARP